MYKDGSATIEEAYAMKQKEAELVQNPIDRALEGVGMEIDLLHVVIGNLEMRLSSVVVHRTVEEGIEVPKESYGSRIKVSLDDKTHHVRRAIARINDLLETLEI